MGGDGVLVARAPIELALQERVERLGRRERRLGGDAGELLEEVAASLRHAARDLRLVVGEVEERRRCGELLPLKQHRRLRREEEQRRQRADVGGRCDLMDALAVRRVRDLIVILQIADEAPRRFVCYLQNHDQIANSADGKRIHQIASPADVRALTALLLLAPQTPMLFQGQEFAASAPFLYFADHKPEVARSVAKGRRDFLQQFPSITAETPLAPPESLDTFLQCKLDWSARDEDAVAFHRELLRMRWPEERVDGAVVSDQLFVLRGASHLLTVNLGDAIDVDPADEPLLAGEWTPSWSSGDAMTELWKVPGHASVILSRADGEESCAT